MRRALAVLLALLTLPPATPAAPGPAPVAAEGPDEEGAYLLLYDASLPGEATVSLRLLVERDDAGDVARGERDLGARRLPAGTTRLELPFLPAEGPGAYAVALALDGHAGEPLRFTANETGGASAEVSWVVPDEPTTLQLANDTVNADGKLKLPGEALVTRARLADGNGVGDVDVVRWLVLRDGVAVDAGPVTLDAAPNATSAAIEHRYARAPMPAGEHALVLRAERDGAIVAEARRTFVIRDVAPSLASLAVPNATPDAPWAVSGDAVLADRNGWDAAPHLEVRVYRGSTRLDGRGFDVTLGPLRPLPDEDGAGRVARMVHVGGPPGATPGLHRVSLYANGTLLGSAAFEVLPLPRLVSAVAEAAPDGVALRIDVTGPAVLDVALRAGEGTVLATHALPTGVSVVHVPAPPGDVAWNATLRAREGGPAVGHAEGRLHAVAPPLDLRPVRPPPRMPALWRVESPGWDLAGAGVHGTLTRWDGATVAAGLSLDDGLLALDAALEPGRYALDVEVRLANGTRGRAVTAFDVAPWVRVALGEPTIAGGEARIPLRNAGAALRGLVVEVEGVDARPILHVAGRALPAREHHGRHVFDAALATDDEAALVLPLPQGPQPAGVHAARVRVLALGARA